VMMSDELDRELPKIEAVADVLVTLETGELAKHTAAGLGVIILEACAAIRECARGKRE
jgi:hypothetical protein